MTFITEIEKSTLKKKGKRKSSSGSTKDRE
jgi:hypothetical protein